MKLKILGLILTLPVVSCDENYSCEPILVAEPIVQISLFDGETLEPLSVCDTYYQVWNDDEVFEGVIDDCENEYSIKVGWSEGGEPVAHSYMAKIDKLGYESWEQGDLIFRVDKCSHPQRADVDAYLVSNQ